MISLTPPLIFLVFITGVGCGYLLGLVLGILRFYNHPASHKQEDE